MATSNDSRKVPVQEQKKDASQSGGIGTWTLVIMLIFVLIMGLVGGWLISRITSAASVASRSSDQAGIEQDAARVSVIEKFRPSVVQINVATQDGKGGLGSGTILDGRGYIVTNEHVLVGAKSVEVQFFDGTKRPAEITGLDPLDDLAVVKVTPTQNMAVATLGDSSKLQVGQTVLAIGSPLGITQTVTGGIVSALGRNVPTGEGNGEIFNSIQMDAAINPGNSGGALVDLQGDIVGVPTLTILNPSFNAPASGVGFSIPANRVKFIAPQLILSGKVTDFGLADLGLNGATITPSVATRLQLPLSRGVLITSVDENGPAAQAGLKIGDMINRLDNTAVTDMSTLRDNVLNKNPGTKVVLQVFRGSNRSTVDVTLGSLHLP